MNEGLCIECGNDEEDHPLPWLGPIDRPPDMTYVEEYGWRWHHFVRMGGSSEVEHGPYKPEDGGPNPPRPTIP